MKLTDPALDAKDLLISRLKHEIEDRERLIGALLDEIKSGPAGSVAYVSEQNYLRPWRRVFVTRQAEESLLYVSVWNERLCPPYRGGTEEHLPSEPLPWDDQSTPS